MQIDASRKLGVKRLDRLFRAKIEARARPAGSKKLPEAKARLKILANLYDKDGNGTIDLDEFSQMLADFGLRELHHEDVKGLFDMFDDDGSGGIDYNEFSRFLTDSFPDTWHQPGQSTAKAITDMPTTYESGTNRFKTPSECACATLLAASAPLLSHSPPIPAVLTS